MISSAVFVNLLKGVIVSLFVLIWYHWWTTPSINWYRLNWTKFFFSHVQLKLAYDSGDECNRWPSLQFPAWQNINEMSCFLTFSLSNQQSTCNNMWYRVVSIFIHRLKNNWFRHQKIKAETPLRFRRMNYRFLQFRSSGAEFYRLCKKTRQ